MKIIFNEIRRSFYSNKMDTTFFVPDLSKSTSCKHFREHRYIQDNDYPEHQSFRLEYDKDTKDIILIDDYEGAEAILYHVKFCPFCGEKIEYETRKFK